MQRKEHKECVAELRTKRCADQPERLHLSKYRMVVSMDMDKENRILKEMMRTANYSHVFKFAREREVFDFYNHAEICFSR